MNLFIKNTENIKRMTQGIFQIVPLRKGSFFQKLFNQYPEENGIIALNNLFAAMPVESVSMADITAIEQRYHVSLRTTFRLNLEEFYAVVLNTLLKNYRLPFEEQNKLKHLETILDMEPASVAFFHEQIGGQLYQKMFREKAKDGRLSETDQILLNNFVVDARIPRATARKIAETEGQAVVMSYVQKILKDRNYSPGVQNELKEITESMKVNLLFSNNVSQQLGKLKQYWELQHLPLPLIVANLPLQKGEACHLCRHNVEWHETRAIRVSGQSVQEMQLIDKGALYLTNNRIVFVGKVKTHNVRYEKIVCAALRGDGVYIEKDTGKSPLLVFSGDGETACILLKRLVTAKNDGHLLI